MSKNLRTGGVTKIPASTLARASKLPATDVFLYTKLYAEIIPIFLFCLEIQLQILFCLKP